MSYHVFQKHYQQRVVFYVEYVKRIDFHSNEENSEKFINELGQSGAENWNPKITSDVSYDINEKTGNLPKIGFKLYSLYHIDAC